MTVFVANTNVLELLGLTDAVTNAAINDAIVSVIVCDNNGARIGGGDAPWPLALAYVAGSAGNYRGTLDATLRLLADTDHVAMITVTAGAGRTGYWEYKFKPTTRT